MARKPGKYEHLVKILKKLPGITGESNGDPKYQDRVDETKRAILVPPEDGNLPDTSLYDRGIEGYLAQADNSVKQATQLLLRRSAGRRHGIEFAHGYAKCRDFKNLVKNWLSSINLLLEAYAQLMAEQMENEDTRGMDVGGRALSVWEEPWTTVVDRDSVRTFFMADKDLVKSLQPMWQTLDSLNRKRLLLGETTVPGTEVFSKKKIRLGSE